MNHYTYACCQEGCAHVICFTPEVDAQLRRSHDWWKCPAGHSQHFTGKTDQEKRIDSLTNEVNRLRRALRMTLRQLHRQNTCWCGASFATPRQLAGHRMGADHWTYEQESA